MRRYFTGLISLILLSSVVFCTIDSLHAHESAPHEHSSQRESVSSAPAVLSTTYHHHEEEVCCDELLSDTPRYRMLNQYQQSHLRPEKSRENFTLSIKVSNSSEEQAIVRLYRYRIPDGIRGHFTFQYAIANPPTGPPA